MDVFSDFLKISEGFQTFSKYYHYMSFRTFLPVYEIFSEDFRRLSKILRVLPLDGLPNVSDRLRNFFPKLVRERSEDVVYIEEIMESVCVRYLHTSWCRKSNE